jgi:ankyrin repeat protein
VSCFARFNLPMMLTTPTRTAADNAWDKILTNSFPQEIERALRLMFSETDCIERRDFTILHKAILGLSSTNLEQLLLDSTADLDAVDNNGRTAVSLAAERGDSITLSTLLKYNPDVNLSSTSGSSPLHFASCARNPSCIKPLLDAGAVVDSLTDWEQTPLIYTAAYVQSALHAELLLDAGASIDWKDRDGITALGWTAIANNLSVAKVLLDRGADVNNVDGNGDTFGTLCVKNSQIVLLRLLTGHRLQQSSLSSSKSLLLVTARYATPATIDVLSGLTLDGVDIGTRDDNGVAWTELLESRPEYDDDMRCSVERLVDHLRNSERQAVDGGGDYISDSDLFEDALEHQ